MGWYTTLNEGGGMSAHIRSLLPEFPKPENDRVPYSDEVIYITGEYLRTRPSDSLFSHDAIYHNARILDLMFAGDRTEEGEDYIFDPDIGGVYRVPTSNPNSYDVNYDYIIDRWFAGGETQSLFQLL